MAYASTQKKAAQQDLLSGFLFSDWVMGIKKDRYVCTDPKINT